MNKITSASLLSLALLAPLAASAADPNLRFDGGIGVVPVAIIGGLPAPNTVFNTPPGGRPWVIERLTATVRGNRISVDGRGLLLAGGDNIGTNGNQSVRARLFCGGLPHDTVQLVPLEPDGDFSIDSALTPPPPNPCANPVLLIISAGGNWFAAGIPKR